MSKLKKVVCIDTGMHDYSLEMMKSLELGVEDEDIDLIYIGPKTIKPKLDAYVGPKIRKFLYEWPRLRSPRNLWLVLQFCRRIWIERPDVIYFPGVTNAWIGPFLWLLPKCRIVATVHDVEIHPGDVYTQRVPSFVNNLVRDKADGLILHSEKLKLQAGEKLNRPLEELFVIPHVVLDRYRWLASIENLVAKKTDFNVLFFGRILYYKGLGTLIQAAELASQTIPEITVTIAGSGPDLERCRKMITKPALFHIHEGYIEEPDAAQYFLNCDVVALPHIEASQSGVTAIAACFGVPVIATDVGDFREVVEQEETGPIGLVVPPDNAQAFAEALIRMATDGEIREVFSENAISSAFGPRSPTAVGKMTKKIFEDVMMA